MKTIYKVMIAFVIAITLALAITGCAPVNDTAPTYVPSPRTLSGSIMRVTDDEAGVVCWVYDTLRGGGISCLPIDQTKLEK